MAGHTSPARQHDSRDCGTSRSAGHRELVLCFWQRRLCRLHASDRNRHPAGVHLCALCRRGLEQPPNSESPGSIRLVRSSASRLGLGLYAGSCPHPHGSSVPVWRVQVSARADVGRGSSTFACDPGDGVHGAGSAIRSGRLLGSWHRSLDSESRSRDWTVNRPRDAWRSDHRRSDSVAILRSPCIRYPRASHRICGRSSPDGSETRNQRVAGAWPSRPPSDISQGVSRAHEEGWHPLRSRRNLERPRFRCRHSPVDRCLRLVFRPLRAVGPAQSHDYSNDATP